ncbi:glycosyltransferase [Aliarcobacter trophiarum LMG 25534]|uniref:Glycosyltransferase n=2 Tax=Aliarcobacter trophiarum TaxID=708186 RepID=A0AAD0VMU7_9BACT|nr:glycosyltransferase [Aliarcobacter trophiarum]AXK49276.1 glycosyltransferase, family 2 [Aliarcobacter trophiarum LMG 25534]RXJ91444.1 glycosyltransferase [Aliarcobacter trophiarum LMG 25534]
MRDLISVIMSVYNEKEEWIIESIDSILNQTYSNFEFIIVLDNPENKILKEILIKYQFIDKRIKIIINKKNSGLIFSLNRALKECEGLYIARMDADDISHKNRFEKQLQYLVDNNLDLIGSNITLFSNKEVFFKTDKLLTHKYLKRLLMRGAIGIVHPTFFVRKKVFDKLGGYNNAFHAEDMEFLSRAIFFGFKVGNIKDVLLNCRYRNNSVTKTNAYIMYKTAQYCTEIFKKSLATGKYIFDDNYKEYFVISEKEKNKLNKKQILMVEARQKLNRKKYFASMLKIIKASISSNSVYLSIKINLYLKMYKFFENIELKRSNKR